MNRLALPLIIGHRGAAAVAPENTLASFAHAYQAPPEVQVAVASWGLVHGGYWGCLRHVPRSTFPQRTSLHLWLAAPRLA